MFWPFVIHRRGCFNKVSLVAARGIDQNLGVKGHRDLTLHAFLFTAQVSPEFQMEYKDTTKLSFDVIVVTLLLR